MGRYRQKARILHNTSRPDNHSDHHHQNKASSQALGILPEYGRVPCKDHVHTRYRGCLDLPFDKVNRYW